MSESREQRPVAPPAAEIELFLRELSLPSPAETQAERIDRIAAMERLKSALAAGQAKETATFESSHRAALAGASFEVRHAARSVASEIGLARRVSPHLGSRYVGLAKALVNELPLTLAAMGDGGCSEWRAMIVTRETACLAPEHRATIDAALAPDLPMLSDREVQGRTRALAYQLDPRAFVDRHRLAKGDRRVTLRPAPDGMTMLSAVLPLQAGVGCLAALKREAAALRASGDDRGEGQAMADTLVQRLTGAESPEAIPVEVQLVMTDASLLGESDVAAHVPGHGPLPAPVARHVLRELPGDTKTWIRRLYLDPVDGRLTALDTKRRLFGGPLRRALIVRDDHCRTPYCDATIKHLDHVVAAEDGGLTSHRNGQGLCEACNYAKQQPGWKARPDPDGGAGVDVTVTTPSGRTYTSKPPPLPGAPPVRHPRQSQPWRIDLHYISPLGHAA